MPTTMDGGSTFSQPSNKVLIGNRFGQPGNPTMVSLVNLHTSNASPDQEALGQAVDSLDPWVQLLVQDRLFIASVQTNKLHAAAAAAVKVIKIHFLDPQHQDDDMPDEVHYPTTTGAGTAATRKAATAAAAAVADGRRGIRGTAAAAAGRAGHHHQEHHHHHHHNHNHHHHNNTHHEPMPPHFAGLLPALHALKQEILTLEDEIPWTLVRRAWKNKRTNWRRLLKTTENVIDLAIRLKELRQYLATDDGSFLGCGPTWQNALEGCIAGKGSFGQLFSVWDEMRNTIRSWLDVKLTTSATTPRVGSGIMMMDGIAAHGSGPQQQVHAGPTAQRALQALQNALKYEDVDKLLQTPLEAIVGYDSQGLHAVRQAVELERRMVAARMAAIEKQQQQEQQQGGGGGQENGTSNTNISSDKPLVSYFSSINAAWEDSDFDSGADTDDAMDSGDVTDLDAEFD